MKDKLLSVVVPCFNEQEVLPATHARLVAAMDGMEYPWELVYVDDGSTDGTWDVLCRLQQQEPRAKLLRFSRNFGHQMAVSAGLDFASGDAVVLIDADLQDPPEIIPEMVKRWEDGYQVAYGQRMQREGETLFKTWTAHLFYRLIRHFSSTDIPLDSGDFRLMAREVVEAARQMREYDRFLRGMVGWLGFRQVAVPYRRAERAAGQTKYPLVKMVIFAVDAILSFSLVPLRLATLLGFVSAAIALAGILYALCIRLFAGNWVSGWASLFVVALFIGGVQLICLGIMGEYVGRIYREVKRRPLYVLADQRGLPTPRP